MNPDPLKAPAHKPLCSTHPLKALVYKPLRSMLHLVKRRREELLGEQAIRRRGSQVIGAHDLVSDGAGKIDGPLINRILGKLRCGIDEPWG